MASWRCATCRRDVELRTDPIGRLWERCGCGTRPVRPIPLTPIIRMTVTVTLPAFSPSQKMVPPPTKRRAAFATTGYTWAREPRTCVACGKPFMGRKGVNAQCCSQPCRWRVYYRNRAANRLRKLG